MKKIAGSVAVNVILLLIGIAAIMTSESGFVNNKWITTSLTLFGSVVFLYAAVRFFFSVKNKKKKA